MRKNDDIGVFDSGVGGTTVLKEIIKILPNENIIYYGDSGNAPYGDRTVENIRELSLKITDFLIKKRCKALVIACNTITAAALDIITEKYDVPVIGVIVPGVRAAISNTKNNMIGVVSTQFTAKSCAYEKEIKKQSHNINVYQEGCKEYCPMIEKGWDTFSDNERHEVIKKHLSVFPKDLDTLVLGCTHYPIAYKDFEREFSGKIIDPAYETAKELKKILTENDELSDSKEKGQIEFYISGEEDKFRDVAEKFLGFKLKQINIVPR